MEMQAERRGPNTSAADVDRIRRALSPAYCAVANSTSHQWSWFWSWLDAYRGMAGHEISRGSRFKLVLHARPDLFFDETFSRGWFDDLLVTKVPFAMLKWDFYGMYSHEHVRLQKICRKRRVPRGGQRSARPVQMPSDIDNQFRRGLCRTVLRPKAQERQERRDPSIELASSEDTSEEHSLPPRLMYRSLSLAAPNRLASGLETLA